MTTPNGSIVISDTGSSDAAASGLGPATAVSGTGASTNNTTTVDLSADSPDLSGVTAGDLLYVGSSAGMQFSIIASVDDGADTVTCDRTFTQTESSRNWAIGGKRATLDGSKRLLSDGQNGWVIELENDQTMTGAISQFSTGAQGTIEVKSDTPGTKRTITINANTGLIDQRVHTKWTDLNIVYDPSVSGSAVFRRIFLVTGTSITMTDCDVGDSSKTDQVCEVASSGQVYASGCNFLGTKGIQGKGVTVIWDCTFKGFSSTQALQVSDPDDPSLVAGCLFKDCTTTAVINQGNDDSVLVYQCVFDNCSTGVSSGNFAAIYGCIFVDCTTALVNDFGNRVFSVGNAFYNNTSDANNTPVEYGKISLTADPFTDSANDDYTLNSTAGGGAACKDAVYPSSDAFGNASNYNCGLYQDSSSGGGGGGGFRRITLNGGMNG